MDKEAKVNLKHVLISGELHKRLSVFAAQRDRFVKEIVQEAVEEYIDATVYGEQQTLADQGKAS